MAVQVVLQRVKVLLVVLGKTVCHVLEGLLAEYFGVYPALLVGKGLMVHLVLYYAQVLGVHHGLGCLHFVVDRFGLLHKGARVVLCHL